MHLGINVGTCLLAHGIQVSHTTAEVKDVSSGQWELHSIDVRLLCRGGCPLCTGEATGCGSSIRAEYSPLEVRARYGAPRVWQVMPISQSPLPQPPTLQLWGNQVQNNTAVLPGWTLQPKPHPVSAHQT